MSAKRVQTQFTIDAAFGNITNPQVGNFLVMILAGTYSGTGNTITSVLDNTGTAYNVSFYQEMLLNGGSGFHGTYAIISGFVKNAGVTSLTVTWSVTTPTGMCQVTEYGNPYPTVTNDGAGVFSEAGVGNTFATINIASAKQNDLVVGGCFNSSANSMALTTNQFTVLNSARKNQFLAVDLLATQTATTTLAFSFTAGGDQPVAFGIAFKNFFSTPAPPNVKTLPTLIDAENPPDGRRIVSQVFTEDYTVSLSNQLVTLPIGVQMAATSYVLNLQNLTTPLSQVLMVILSWFTANAVASKLLLSVDCGNGVVFWIGNGTAAGDGVGYVILPAMTTSQQITVTVYTPAANINTAAIQLTIAATNFDTHAQHLLTATSDTL